MDRAAAPLALARLALALLAAGAPSPPRATDREWTLQAEAGGGVDTNPTRVAATEVARALALAVVRARGRLEEGDWRARGAFSAGARWFPGAAGSSALASRLEAGGSLALSGPWTLTASLLAADLSEQAGALDQDEVRADLALRLDGSSWSAAAWAGGQLAAPRAADLRPFLSAGPSAGLRGSWAAASRHQLSAGAGFALSGFPRWPGPRRDQAWILSADYGWRGPTRAALGYAYTASTSTAPGAGFERHRLTGRLALALGSSATLLLRGALVRTRYPRALDLGQQLRLEAGDEGLDLAEARLALPLGESFELGLSAARSWADLGSGGPTLGRTLATTSLSGRLSGE